jgi:tetratricopeptide (TPR) repeat protein
VSDVPTKKEEDPAMSGFFAKLKDLLGGEPDLPPPARGIPIPSEVPRRYPHPPTPVPADDDAPWLPPYLEERIDRVTHEADTLAADEEHGAAVAMYMRALEMVPEPKTEWEATRWMLIGIGDACFLAGGYEQARNAFLDAMHCPNGFDDGFIHLRLAQIELELGNEEKAAQGLAHAYRKEGSELFEDEDPKYVAFMKAKLPPPPGGWPAGW